MLVIKPNYGMGGTDIYRINNEKEIENILYNSFKKNNELAVSPFENIDSEYRVTILDGEVLNIYKKKKSKKEFQFNLSKGAAGCGVQDLNLKNKLIDLSIRSGDALNLRLANIDIIKNKNGKLKILEVNNGIMFEYYSGQGVNEYEIVKNIYFKILDKLMEK